MTECYSANKMYKGVEEIFKDKKEMKSLNENFAIILMVLDFTVKVNGD